MQQSDNEDLDGMYKQWPIEKLARALTVEIDQYNPEAIPAMKRALESHGLSKEELDAVVAEVAAEHEVAIQKLSRIRGVLLLFIVIVAFNSLTDLFTSVTFVAAPRSVHIAFRLLAVPFAILGLYGLYCSSVLLRRKRHAPTHARRWLVWSAVFGTGVAALSFFVLGELSLGAAGPAVFALIWLGYLSDSRRVALVYGPQQDSAGNQ